jgi:hypothetical protein
LRKEMSSSRMLPSRALPIRRVLPVVTSISSTSGSSDGALSSGFVSMMLPESSGMWTASSTGSSAS